MKFENVGNWMKEAEEDKLVFDNREPADYLNGDDEICTLKTEDDESDYDDDFSGELLDEVESDEDELESPDNEEDAIVMSEAFGPEDIVPYSKQIEFKKQYLQGKDKRKVNTNSFYFDDIYAVDDNTGSNIPGAKLGIKYKELASALDKFFGESAQKNEGSNWEYSVNVLDSYGDVQYSTTCNSQSDIDKAIKKYKDRAVELRSADGCRTIEVTKDLVNDDGDILKTQSIKKMSLESAQKNEALDREKAMELIGAWKSSLMGDNGDFEMHLAKACQHADKNNLMKLEKAFPQLLQKFCAWKSSGKTDRVAQL